MQKLFVLCCPVLAVLAAAPDALFRSLQSDDAPGAAILAMRDDRIVFQRGYGIADLKTRVPITSATNFRLASVTKQFTAMAVMLLIHDGKLRYDTRLTDIFPDFPKFGEAIHIRHLLTHTAGLQDYEDLMDSHARGQIQDAGVLDLLKRTTETKFPPGTRFEYSNSAYVVLGMVVAKVSGMPFGQFLHDRIFAPLHMDHTIAYQKDQNEVPRRAYGYSKAGNGWSDTDQSPTSATLGDGGVYSSVVDMEKWMRALNHYTLLSKSEMAPAWTPIDLPPGAIKFDGVETGYGFGWAIDTFHGQRRIWHSGTTSGFRTYVLRLPERHLAVIVLANRTDLEPQELAAKAAELYLQ